MEIIKATVGDKEIIRQIATATWQTTYDEILSSAQSEYMLDMMYSDESLANQMQSGHQFVLIKDNKTEEVVGFTSYELNYENRNKTKIHKLYVLPGKHGLGIGNDLVEYVYSQAKTHDNSAVVLNMNRFNKSAKFYIRLGFTIVGEEDIDIGSGYLMEDYIFEKMII